MHGRNSSCPGENVVFTCILPVASHRWIISGPDAINKQLGAGELDRPEVFGSYTINVIEVVEAENRILSTVTVESFPGLNGVVLICRDNTVISNPDEQTITANVLGKYYVIILVQNVIHLLHIADIRAIALSSMQETNTSTRLFWTVPSSSEECITAGYFVNISGVGVISTSSNSLVVSTTNGIAVKSPTSFTVTSNPGGSPFKIGSFTIVNIGM